MKRNNQTIEYLISLRDRREKEQPGKNKKMEERIPCVVVWYIFFVGRFPPLKKASIVLLSLFLSIHISCSSRSRQQAEKDIRGRTTPLYTRWLLATMYKSRGLAPFYPPVHEKEKPTIYSATILSFLPLYSSLYRRCSTTTGFFSVQCVLCTLVAKHTS